MRFVLFTSEHCAPCHQAAQELADLEVETADVSGETRLALRCGVRSVPTLVAIGAGGKPLSTYHGRITNKEVRRWIAKLEGA